VGKKFAVGNFSWDIYRACPPPPSQYLNIEVDSWHHAVGMRCRIPLRNLSQLNVRFAVGNFSLYIYRAPPPPPKKKNSKYQSWHLTPCCGFDFIMAKFLSTWGLNQRYCPGLDVKVLKTIAVLYRTSPTLKIASSSPEFQYL
jgi:hypothetical protein